MSQLSTHHQELVNGEGRCSVPMWMMGIPSGFCDALAYGKEEAGQKRYGDWERGRWIPHYVPALACHNHGGPKHRTHLGDPCRWCHVPHDDVLPGPCPGLTP